jgi:hypothetical protein
VATSRSFGFCSGTPAARARSASTLKLAPSGKKAVATRRASATGSPGPTVRRLRADRLMRATTLSTWKTRVWKPMKKHVNTRPTSNNPTVASPVEANACSMLQTKRPSFFRLKRWLWFGRTPSFE